MTCCCSRAGTAECYQCQQWKHNITGDYHPFHNPPLPYGQIPTVYIDRPLDYDKLAEKIAKLLKDGLK